MRTVPHVFGPAGVGLVPQALTDQGILICQEEGGRWYVTRPDKLYIDAEGGEEPWPEMSLEPHRVRLDLSGNLDFGTRALFRLMYPDAEEPLTAPEWAADYDVNGRLHGWQLLTAKDTVWFEDWLDSRPAGAIDWDQESANVPGIRAEPDPRRALALTLTAVAAWRAAEGTCNAGT